MSEEWDVLTRKVERSEKRINRMEMCAPLAGVWTASLSAVQSQAEKTFFSASRGRVIRISYYLVASAQTAVALTMNGETLSFSHPAGNPCMTLTLPLLQGGNTLRVRITSGASGVSRGGVCAEQLDVQI